MTERKQRVDSKEQRVATMIAANREIKPPASMEFSDLDHENFNEIIDEFASIQWTNHTVKIAAILARTITDMIEDQEALREEGSVAYSEKGTPVANPRRTACQGYASQIMNMRRSLALHATAGTTKRDKGIETAHRKAAENDANGVTDDDLINTPSLN